MSNTPPPPNPWGHLNPDGGQAPDTFEPPAHNPGSYPPPTAAPAQPNRSNAGGYPPPVAPKKTSNRSIFLVVGGMFFLGLTLFGACSYFVFQVGSAPYDAANEYLAALETGDYEAARSLTVDAETEEELGCTASLINASFEVGEIRLDALVIDRDLTSSDSGTFEDTDIDGTEISGTYRTIEGSFARDISVTLVDTDSDGWRVCRTDLSNIVDE